MKTEVIDLSLGTEGNGTSFSMLSIFQSDQRLEWPTLSVFGGPRMCLHDCEVCRTTDQSKPETACG
jgi:hypothetical protein